MNINQRIIENFASSIFVFNHVLQGKMNRFTRARVNPSPWGKQKHFQHKTGANSVLSLSSVSRFGTY